MCFYVLSGLFQKKAVCMAHYCPKRVTIVNIYIIYNILGVDFFKNMGCWSCGLDISYVLLSWSLSLSFSVGVGADKNAIIVMINFSQRPSKCVCVCVPIHSSLSEQNTAKYGQRYQFPALERADNCTV